MVEKKHVTTTYHGGGNKHIMCLRFYSISHNIVYFCMIKQPLTIMEVRYSEKRKQGESI